MSYQLKAKQVNLTPLVLTSEVHTVGENVDPNQFILAQTPADSDGVLVVVNNTGPYSQDYWTLVGTTLEWTGVNPALVVGWQIVIWYQVAVS